MNIIKFDANGLPSIWDVMLTEIQASTRFVIPASGREIVDCYVNIATGLNLSTELRIRRLTLACGCAVPFHRNPRRDKFLLLVKGRFTVMRHLGRDLDQMFLGSSQKEMLITKDTSHALVATGEGENELKIITAPVVDDDVIWEAQAQILAQNRHLKVERVVRLGEDVRRIS